MPKLLLAAVFGALVVLIYQNATRPEEPTYTAPSVYNHAPSGPEAYVSRSQYERDKAAQREADQKAWADQMFAPYRNQAARQEQDYYNSRSR